MILRLPTSYNQHRTDSGRLSSGMDNSDPDKTGRRKKSMQMQNIPRKARDMFVPEPGFAFVGADYKSIEWGVMMWYGSRLGGTFHANLLKKFQAGELDPHRFLASVFYECEESAIKKKQRDVVKPFTYGYYTNAISVGRRAGHSDSVSKRIGEAHERAFRMNEIRAWMLSEVKKKKYAETALGFRRYWWEWNPKPEEVFAHYGQGTAADIMKWALLKLYKDYSGEVLTSTHDSVLTQVPLGTEVESSTQVRDIMQQPCPFTDNHPWKVDTKVGMNWQAVS